MRFHCRCTPQIGEDSVHSLTTDEAQAKGIIDVWVSKGYSLRHIIIDSLIFLGSDDSQNRVLEKKLVMVMDLLLSIDHNNKLANEKSDDVTLSDKFVRSIE